jgi:amino acid transporter
MSTPDNVTDDSRTVAEDVKTLHAMGYAQELSRRMHGFSNFAISFSIICILSGGINSLGQGIGGVGGAAIGIGWPLGCLVSLVFALGMAQIASAYPTAGGLYHWGSILGGVGWGWLTAWFNLLGLITVLGAINVGTWSFFSGAFAAGLGIEASYTNQVIFVVLITGTQALFNHLGIGLTTKLTDLSGYLILAITVILTAALLFYAPSIDLSRLWTFHNYSGDAGGGVWPQSDSIMFVFLLGLLLPIYTITGFDASAHTSEETVDAARAAPRGMVQSVVISMLAGWILLCAFVLAIPDMGKAAASGWSVFFTVTGEVLPAPLVASINIGILLAQYLCGLATVTSVSRMIFAFARDEGLPASTALKRVHHKFRVPVAAIWVGAALGVLFTMYTPVYSTVVSVTVIFLFISYGLPVILGAFAWGKGWTKMGPWNMGETRYKLVALLVFAAMCLIFALGIQPPNDKALNITVGFLALTAVLWFAVERRRFKGPPQGVMIQSRQQQILEAEKAVGEAAAGQAATG